VVVVAVVSTTLSVDASAMRRERMESVEKADV
jgi:hypothetical protein